jgi:Spy/CpxP family protein refolding chaperone
MMGGPVGKWWDNPEISARLGLSDEQRKKMDDIFQANRIRLIDLRASLEKEEAMLDPLMQAATPDDSKLLPQIDKVAQARAELEKADARLLLGLRHVLSPQQWQNLQAERPQPTRPAMGVGGGVGSGFGRGVGGGMGPGNPPPAPPAMPPPGGRGPGGEGDKDK